MGHEDLLVAWEFPESFELEEIEEIARDELAPPDLRARLVSRRGRCLTVQVLEGEITTHVPMLLYVRGRGAFSVIRREVWPDWRVLITLAAWPDRRPPARAPGLDA